MSRRRSDRPVLRLMLLHFGHDALYDVPDPLEFNVASIAVLLHLLGHPLQAIGRGRLALLCALVVGDHILRTRLENTRACSADRT